MYVGAVEPIQEVMDGWTKLFASLGHQVVDSGNPFGAGIEVSKLGSKELALDAHAISGYTIINAESSEEVKKLVSEHCPMITSVKIYEALPM